MDHGKDDLGDAEGGRASPTRATDLHVVGLGASAGGLEALEELLDAAGEGEGLAYVVVVHLAPDRVSLLPELLQRHSAMPVLVAADGQRVEAGHVYVLPPGRALHIRDEVLRTTELDSGSGRILAVDAFFRSLAMDLADRAICAVLSGTGSDGTAGLREVKAQGGIVLVQDPASARYDGMPRSALASGLADAVLTPAAMPERMADLARSRRAGAAPEEPLPPAALDSIVHAVRVSSGHDFSQYKEATIGRRVSRRMAVQQIDDPMRYARYVQESEGEADVLFRELLIGVTSFFRDPGAFDALEKRILPELLEHKAEGSVMRVWVPACSSGEEVYSVAMVLADCARASGRHPTLQVFGTDIDEAAIQTARAGLYAETVAEDVPPERLARYFVKEQGGGYRVRRSLRELVVFAPQSVIKDPPFTKLDMLSCRNLLIYLKSRLQRHLVTLFHYALSPSGVLLLGSSETVGDAADLFEPVDTKWKIYRARPGTSRPKRPADIPLSQPDGATVRASGHLVAPRLDRGVVPILEALLHEAGQPACVVVDETGEAVYIHGRTGRYLEPVEGVPSANVVAMARPGLRPALAAALKDVAAHGKEVVLEAVQVRQNGDIHEATVRLKPIHGAGVRGHTLVVFEAASPRDVRSPREGPALPQEAAGGALSGRELQLELAQTRSALEATVEELQLTNEELRSANEELQSTNEELQSTNEELETSKEELQSLNEEATSANAELQGRIEELTRTTDDMKNLLDSTEIAVIFLDVHLCIRRFTPKATAIIPLSPVDAGRPIRHLASELEDVDIEARATAVLDDLATRVTVVSTRRGRRLRMRIRPYRTVENVIDGVVITFEDVTEIDSALGEAERAGAVTTSVIEALGLAVAAVDADLRVVFASRRARSLLGLDGAPVEGEPLLALLDVERGTDELEAALRKVLPEDRPISGLRVVAELPGAGRRPVLVDARRLEPDPSSGDLIAVTFSEP